MKKIIVLLYISLSFAIFGITFDSKEIYKTPLDKSRYGETPSDVLLDSEIMDFSGEFPVTKYHIIRRINDYSGKKDFSEFRIYYYKDINIVNINKAVTIKAGTNQEIPVNKENIQLMDSPSDVGKMSYSLTKMMLLAFQAVDTGDILDIEYTITDKSGLKLSNAVTFASYEPIYRKYYEVIFSDKNTPSVIKRNFNNNITEEKFNNSVYYYGEKLPKVSSESGTPTLGWGFPSVYTYTYNDWNDYKNILLAKFKGKISVSSDIKSLAMKLTDNCKTNLDKADALKNYMAKSIRNIGVSNPECFEFKTPDEIVKCGYASPFDRTILFISLLKAVGIEAVPFAVGKNPLLFEPRQYVDSISFCSFITLAFIDGKEVFISPVSEFYPIGYSPNLGDVGFAVTDEKIEFKEVLPQYDNGNKYVEENTIDITNDSSAVVSSSSISYGSNGVSVVSKYKYMNLTEKKRDYDSFMFSISNTVVPITEILNVGLSFPATVSYSYRYNDFMTDCGDYRYFDIPGETIPISVDTDPAKRKNPYAYFGNSLSEAHYKIKLPDGYEILFYPQSSEIISKIYKLSRSIKIEGQVMYIDTYISTFPGIANLKEYKTLYDYSVEYTHPKYTRVLLKKIK